MADGSATPSTVSLAFTVKNITPKFKYYPRTISMTSTVDTPYLITLYDNTTNWTVSPFHRRLDKITCWHVPRYGTGSYNSVRVFDADDTTLHELADASLTLITDLQRAGVLR